MPHGRLTPLGKQLRCVLANFTTTRVVTRTRTLPTSPSRPELFHHAIINGNVLPAGIFSTRTIAIASARADEAQKHSFNPIPAADPDDEPSPRASRERPQTDHVGNALKATANGLFQFEHRALEGDLADVDENSWHGHDDESERTQLLLEEDGRHADPVSLQRILEHYMTEHAAQTDILSADWQSTYTPSAEETELLRAKGYTIEDVAAWAEIVDEEHILDAAQRLVSRNSTHGVLATPLSILLSLLRRSYMNAHALRVLLETARIMFDERAQLLADPRADGQLQFLVVVRLLHHARQVWPACMPHIVQLVLQNTQQEDWKEAHLEGYREQLALKSYQLNELMSLVSRSTNEHAFKNGDYQEAALVSILRYMSEHEPSLHINRSGYRAVIRIQLAQRKTSDEQHWAELKALSWPPWKEDRTGMDVLITKEIHGMSRASQTLMRMREAGYGPLIWEQLAQVYAGWDIDGTPTIQRRVRLDEDSLPKDSPDSATPSTKDSPDPATQSAQWAARIASTRTIQEAWACYLAWEDKHLPPDQGVFLAILIKLREEQRRPVLERRRTFQRTQQKAWQLFPGDARELSPLPPSTHLETYTRTRPPTPEEFYHDLKERHMHLRGHALAFIVRHARTLPFGLAVLRDSAGQYPGIMHMLSRERTPELLSVPTVVFTAVVEMFVRFGEVHGPLPRDDASDAVGDIQDLNHRSCIVQAIKLLRSRPEPHVYLWNAVHAGLTREHNIRHFSSMFLKQRSDEASSDQIDAGIPEDIQHCAGAFQAYRLSRYIRDFQASHHVELSTSAFYSFCIVTEYRAVATWTVFQVAEANSHNPLQQNSAVFEKLVDIAKTMYRAGCDHDVRTAPQPLFDQFVGVAVKTTPSGTDLPRLLNVPSPAVLHAYIRALGWLRRYQALLELVNWMREYRVEILEGRRRDRNGDAMTRRAIVALRVFLERSWLPRFDAEVDQDNMNNGSAIAVTRQRLKAFREPAPQEKINAIKSIVEEVEEWGGWPSDEEVEHYSLDKRFQPFIEYEMKRGQSKDKYVPLA